ncbi:hypothetical protein [Ralstonia pseudosolanacearum]|uniref:hypothetical protein n=1 Tax=Ralstonia pseudosolanacearum TaxID=1310165 RepID=UPI001FF75516|nr:hypothetical protein [Ralstonia pseudosolanacearum]
MVVPKKGPLVGLGQTNDIEHFWSEWLQEYAFLPQRASAVLPPYLGEGGHHYNHGDVVPKSLQRKPLQATLMLKSGALGTGLGGV